MLIPIAPWAFLPLVLLSLLAGILLGAIYDIFRIRRVAFRLPREERTKESRIARLFRRHLALTDTLLCFGEDLIFCLFGTVVLILMTYKLYYGVPRWYAFGATALGFWGYRMTLGRLVMRSAERVIDWIRRAVAFIRRRILLPVIGWIKGWIKTCHQRAVHQREIAYTKAEEARMLAVFAQGSPQGEVQRKETETQHEKDGSL
jgi:hypothetical protein